MQQDKSDRKLLLRIDRDIRQLLYFTRNKRETEVFALQCILNKKLALGANVILGLVHFNINKGEKSIFVTLLMLRRDTRTNTTQDQYNS